MNNIDDAVEFRAVELWECAFWRGIKVFKMMMDYVKECLEYEVDVLVLYEWFDEFIELVVW